MDRSRGVRVARPRLLSIGLVLGAMLAGCGLLPSDQQEMYVVGGFFDCRGKEPVCDGAREAMSTVLAGRAPVSQTLLYTWTNQPTGTIGIQLIGVATLDDGSRHGFIVFCGFGPACEARPIEGKLTR